MEPFAFFKMCGAGNDFMVADNRNGAVALADMPLLAKRLCRHKLSVGADGLIFIENSDKADFAWNFYNSDGSRAEMCGNGARCAARFAYLNGIVNTPAMKFETLAGIIEAEVLDGRVKVRLTDPTEVKYFHPLAVEGGSFSVASVNTGVPHVVVRVEDLEKALVDQHGRAIRYHEDYAPAGTNVNFVEMQRGDTIKVRTYERGVEGETLACGTGSVASALMANSIDGRPSPVKVITRSGSVLTVHFKKIRGGFTDVYLEGDARVISKGTWEPEALD